MVTAVQHSATAVAVYKTTKLPAWSGADMTWDGVALILWTGLEANVIIVAACIPMLRPVWDQILGAWKKAKPSWGRGGRGGSRQGYLSDDADTEHSSPPRGYWTRKLYSIVSSISTRSSTSTMSRFRSRPDTATMPTMPNMRTLEEAVLTAEHVGAARTDNFALSYASSPRKI